MAKAAKQEINQLSYEEAFAELEEIVARLESDSSSLEESLALFERGQALSKHCGSMLDQAELRVRVLANDVSSTMED